MSEAYQEFLEASGWGGAALTQIAGDLSARKFFRLRKGAKTAVLMVCAEPNYPSLAKFILIADWLRNLGLSAPEVFAADTQDSLAILQDFGDSKLTALIARDASIQKRAYGNIVDTLITIRGAKSPIGLDTPTVDDLCAATRLTDEWYPGADTQALDGVRTELAAILTQTLKAQATVSLRDFHADNIIWLPDQSPAQRAGLLDFQDAFLTHPAYDLMSLLTDARTNVPQSVRDQITRLYCERTGDDINQMRRSMAALGIQRNLRILGIFTSAAIRDAKPYHLPSLPRVYSNLMTCAAHPAMGALAFSLRDALPEPTPDYLARITA